MITAYGFATWVNHVFAKAKPTYNYKNKGPVHHIVPENARDKTDPPKVNLHEAREMMDKNYPGEGVETRLNKIKLSAITHAPHHCIQMLIINLFNVILLRLMKVKNILQI